MLNAIANLIIWLLVLGILYALAEYVISNLIPEPPAKIVRVAMVVLIALAVILLLLDLVGVGGGLDLPKVTVQ
jgi:uncharacterized membrane protein